MSPALLDTAAILHFSGDLKQFLFLNKHYKLLKNFASAVEQPFLGQGTVLYPATRRASIKDIIESLGPPHALVGSLVINRKNSTFSHIIAPGDEVFIHPLTPPCDVREPSLLRPDPLPGYSFLVDANAGRLAKHLRLLGFDTAYDPGLTDKELASTAASENRIVVTKDRNLLKRSIIVYGYLIRSEEPQFQLRELLRFFGLKPPYRFYSRCIHCNGKPRPVAKETIMDRLLPLTRKHIHDFVLCPDCNRIYWRGSHHERMRERYGDLYDG